MDQEHRIFFEWTGAAGTYTHAGYVPPRQERFKTEARLVPDEPPDDEIERQEFFFLYKLGVAKMLPPVLRQRLLVARRPGKLCAYYLELFDCIPEVLQLEHHHAAGSS